MKGKTIGLGKVWGSILFIGMFSAFLLAPGSLFGADRIVLKATTAFPKNMRFNMHVPKLIELIEKDSGGRIKVVWLGGPEVVKTFDQANALKRGVVDMLLYTPFAYFKSLMPVSLAKGLSECTPWEERKNGAYELWSKMFEEKVNAKYLGCMHANLAFHIFSKKKIEKMADFKGFVCRVMPLYVPFMKSIGASPVTMPPTEVYTALQRGVVEGFMWPVFISDWGWQEVVKYVIFPGVFQIEAATVMNIKKWNSIPKTFRTSLSRPWKKWSV